MNKVTKRVPWTTDEIERLKTIWADGAPDRLKRALEAFPSRTYGGIVSQAQVHCAHVPGRRGIEIVKPPQAPVAPEPEPAVAVRLRPSSVSLHDRIPDFLRPDFASWGVG